MYLSLSQDHLKPNWYICRTPSNNQIHLGDLKNNNNSNKHSHPHQQQDNCSNPPLPIRASSNPLLAPNSPVAAAPESELLLTIARKKAEIAAATAAATQELRVAALEKAAGIFN
jgi:hypothetical protein